MAFAAVRLWAVRECVGWLVSAGPQSLLPALLALCLPLGLGVVAGPRWPRWLGGLVLLVAGAFATLSVVGFLVAASATGAVALVAGARRARSAALLALAAAGLAALTVRYAARSAAGCSAMAQAEEALPVLDALCAGSASGEPPEASGAPALPPEVRVSCRDGGAELRVPPVFPLLPGFLLAWEYARDEERWVIRD
jgi:hypothetical protein